MVNYILPRGGGAVKPPSLPSDSPYTPRQTEGRQTKERQTKEQTHSRVRRGMGYYKHLVTETRKIISQLQLPPDYSRAIMGTIAKALDGKIVNRDEYFTRLLGLRPRSKRGRRGRVEIGSLLLAQAAALPAKEDLRPLQGRDGRPDRRAMLTLLSGGGS
jgi:hypothetical protein